MKPLIKTSLKIAILFIVSFNYNFCQAQPSYGEIRGTTKDAKSFEILDYATIVIKQDGILKASTSSDENGKYIITNLPAGEYTMEVTFIGYTKYVVFGVKVNSGAITFVNCQLKIKSEEYIIDDGCWFTLCIPLINETDNKRTLYSKDILRMPMRD